LTDHAGLPRGRQVSIRVAWCWDIRTLTLSTIGAYVDRHGLEQAPIGQGDDASPWAWQRRQTSAAALRWLVSQGQQTWYYSICLVWFPI